MTCLIGLAVFTAAALSVSGAPMATVPSPKVDMARIDVHRAVVSRQFRLGIRTSVYMIASALQNCSRADLRGEHDSGVGVLFHFDELSVSVNCRIAATKNPCFRS